MENILAIIAPERKWVVLRQSDDLLLLGSRVQELSSGDTKALIVTIHDPSLTTIPTELVTLAECAGVVEEIQFQQINDRISGKIFTDISRSPVMPLEGASTLQNTVTQVCDTDARSMPHYVTFTSEDLLVLIANKQRIGQSFMLRSNGLSHRGTLHECINEWRTRIIRA